VAWQNHRQGFIAGLHDAYAVTDSGGEQAGVQVNLSPVGARLVLRVPMRDLRGRVVALEAAFGAAGPRLREQLLDAPGWEERFAIVDEFLLARVAGGEAPPASLSAALERLQTSRGAIDIGSLTAEIGCSRRYLIALFNEHVGVPPKLLARILRFEHALERAESRTEGGWAEIAQSCGYYDQAHMIRDFHQFTGHSPSGYVRLNPPTVGV
jgi:AraC-like DNA-binding protein